MADDRDTEHTTIVERDGGGGGGGVLAVPNSIDVNVNQS